jgi:hypothetical protein
MGRRGPKPNFTNVFSHNKDCEDYGKIENVIDNGTYNTK